MSRSSSTLIAFRSRNTAMMIATSPATTSPAPARMSGVVTGAPDSAGGAEAAWRELREECGIAATQAELVRFIAERDGKVAARRVLDGIGTRVDARREDETVQV